jgi:hypothetical protein
MVARVDGTVGRSDEVDYAWAQLVGADVAEPGGLFDL